MGMKRFWVAGLLCGCLSAATVFAQGIKGIYVGQIESTSQPGDVIPLQISLYPTNEFKNVNGARIQVIDAAFLIDDEGGPFGFSDLRYDVNTGYLELFYTRPQLNGANSSPNFKLEGNLDANGNISGQVQALSSGFTGKFSLKKSEQQFLAVKAKYTRSWNGQLKRVDGQVVPLTVELANSMMTFQNPPAFDFEYSRGRLSSSKYGDMSLSTNQVYVDYFKHEVSMESRTSDGGTIYSLIFKLNGGGKTISGILTSAGDGYLGTFDLNRVGG